MLVIGGFALGISMGIGGLIIKGFSCLLLMDLLLMIFSEFMTWDFSVCLMAIHYD